MNKDLTVGRPETVLRQFCLPLFGSIIFQQLYNIADSFVAGKLVILLGKELGEGLRRRKVYQRQRTGRRGQQL